MALFKKETKPKKVKKEKPPKGPKEKRFHKRPSILEIASLISLFAIVGTVGFLVYKNHFRKQVPETDKELVNQLNASLEKRFKDGQQVDLTEAIDGIESDGIIFSRLTLTDSNSELIFDSTKNLFGVFEVGKGVTYPQEIVRKESKVDTTLWKFAKKNPNEKAEVFSYYLLDGCTGKVTVIGGVDVGKNQDITLVSYINSKDIKQDVVIKTNSYETELVVTETVGDTISHYGRLGKLNVNKLHTDSYHEYGDCKYAYVPAGRVVAEKGGNIDVAYVLSQVAFLQEKDGGSISKAYASTYRVRNASNIQDEKYGKKKTLAYDDNETQEENENIAISAGEAAQFTAVVEERIERGLENHPNAIGYAREEGVITIFDSYKEAVDHFKNTSITEPGVVTVTGNATLSEVLNISNKSITFRADENVMPSITGNIEISHTSGNHQVIFENIKFINKVASRNNIFDYSTKGTSTKQNSLQFKNCSFTYNAGKSDKATIALAATEGVISTQLTVQDCSFSYSGYGQVGISTHALLSNDSVINRGSQIISIRVHVIKNNSFKCGTNNLNPAIVSNYAEIKENTFDGYDTSLELIPTLLAGDDCQFNITSSGNAFRNGRFIFSLVDADYCMDSSNFIFNFDNTNSYYRMKHVANFDTSTTSRYVQKTINSWKARSWSGVSDRSIGVTLDSMVMDLDVAPSYDYFTLSNGDRITSFTQVDCADPRTGYTLQDDEGNTYYFYATFNKEVNVLFREDTNDAYVTLLGNGNVESLKVKDLEGDVNWLDESIFDDEATYRALKYYNVSARIGALYKVDDIFTTIGGNTYKNCEITLEEKYTRVNELSEGNKPVELYISDIGEKQKLVLTNDTNPFVTDTTSLVISLPEDANVVLSGRYNVELKGTLENLTLKDRLHITLLEGSRVNSIVEISGENAANIDFRNYGTLDSVVVNAEGNIANYGVINYLCTGYVSSERYIEQTLLETAGASIENNGSILHIETFAKTNIFNFSGGQIQNLTVNYVKGFEDLSSGSSITNNGTMCNLGGFISIYAQCRFINLGIVGSDSSTGYIVIGDQGESNAHDGTVITNAGIMWAGKDDDNNTRLFVVYGIDENVGEVGPEIRINNTHTLRGVTTYDEAVYVAATDISPILDISLNL